MAFTEIIILLGGVFNLGFVIFHLFFWRIFDWKNDLTSLSFINRQVMQILNLCLMFCFFIFSYISFFHTPELLNTGLGHALLLLIAIFWFLRAAEQVIFFGIKQAMSLVLFILFVIGGLLYVLPWIVVV